MQVAEFGRARTLAEGMGIDTPKSKLDLHQIQRGLRQNEVILAYWLSDKQSYLWAVTPSQNKFFRLPPRREIDQAVESYNAQVQERRKMEDSPGSSMLYNMLVKPAEALLPRDAHVIVNGLLIAQVAGDLCAIALFLWRSRRRERRLMLPWPIRRPLAELRANRGLIGTTSVTGLLAIINTNIPIWTISYVFGLSPTARMRPPKS